MKLHFDKATLQLLIEHAQSCSRHEPTLAMMSDPLLLKDGVTLRAGTQPSYSNVDLGKVPAHLQLVQDDGVYLMSSGIPILLENNAPLILRPMEQPALDLESGFDMVVALPLELFNEAMLDGRPTVRMELLSNCLCINSGEAFKWNQATEPLNINPESLKLAKSLAGSIDYTAARPGSCYSGNTLLCDDLHCYQKVGIFVVIHELNRLQFTPAQGTNVMIDYPIDEKQFARTEIIKARHVRNFSLGSD